MTQPVEAGGHLLWPGIQQLAWDSAGGRGGGAGRPALSGVPERGPGTGACGLQAAGLMKREFFLSAGTLSSDQ